MEAYGASRKDLLQEFPVHKLIETDLPEKIMKMRDLVREDHFRDDVIYQEDRSRYQEDRSCYSFSKTRGDVFTFNGDGIRISVRGEAIEIKTMPGKGILEISMMLNSLLGDGAMGAGAGDRGIINIIGDNIKEVLDAEAAARVAELEGGAGAAAAATVVGRRSSSRSAAASGSSVAQGKAEKRARRAALANDLFDCIASGLDGELGYLLSNYNEDLDFLLNNGVVDVKSFVPDSPGNETLLSYACRIGQIEAAKLLLEHGSTMLQYGEDGKRKGCVGDFVLDFVKGNTDLFPIFSRRFPREEEEVESDVFSVVEGSDYEDEAIAKPGEIFKAQIGLTAKQIIASSKKKVEVLDDGRLCVEDDNGLLTYYQGSAANIITKRIYFVSEEGENELIHIEELDNEAFSLICQEIKVKYNLRVPSPVPDPRSSEALESESKLSRK